MALAHQLVVITRENKEENLWLDTERVFLSDLLFCYMEDSLMWIDTRWNGRKTVAGFLEGGFTVVDCKEIEKFQEIMEQWKQLFLFSPEEFYLTRDTHRKKHKMESVLVRRQEIIEELNGCIHICERALETGAKILYSEI